MAGKDGCSRPMSSWYKDALVSLKGKLKSYVLVKTSLHDSLETPAGGFMSKTEADSVRALPNNGDQMDKIIEILQGKGDEDFQTFCKILHDANYKHWAGELERKAEELSKRIEELRRKRARSSSQSSEELVLPHHKRHHDDYLDLKMDLIAQDMSDLRSESDPNDIIKLLYSNALDVITKLLDPHLSAVKMAANKFHRLGLHHVTVPEREITSAGSINELLDKMYVIEKWDNTRFLRKAVAAIPYKARERKVAELVLSHYNLHLICYERATFLKESQALGKQKPESKDHAPSDKNTKLEITISKPFCDVTCEDCHRLHVCVLSKAYGIPEKSITYNEAEERHSTTITYLIPRQYINEIMRCNTLLDTVWVLLELDIIEVAIPEVFLFKPSVDCFLRMLRESKIFTVDLLGMTEVLPYQMYALVDANVAPLMRLGRPYLGTTAVEEGYRRPHGGLTSVWTDEEEIMSGPVSPAATSNMEMESISESQHTLGQLSRKRAPSQSSHDSKQAKESDRTNNACQQDIDEIGFNHCTKVALKRFKSEQGKTDEAVKFLYFLVCQRISQILCNQSVHIKEVMECCEEDLMPYKGLSQAKLTAIAESSTVFRMMEILDILAAWLNTSYLECFILTSTVLNSHEQARADYWLNQYNRVLDDFCCQFFINTLPRKFYEELNKMGSVYMKHHSTLTVQYKRDFANFTLNDLRKETAFLEKVLDLPPQVIIYLQSEEINNTTVYWAFDMSYVVHMFSMSDVRQLFWKLLEHCVLSLELKGVMSISLRGRHAHYLIKNALQTGQNLIQQTEVFTRQFHALVGLGVTKHSLENADTVRHRTVYRKFVQSFTEKSSKPEVPLDQPVSAASLQVTFEKKTPVKESQVGRTDKEVGHPKDEQQLAAPIHHHPVPPLELPRPFPETVDMSSAPAMTAEQELLLPPDSSPAGKPQDDEWQELTKKYAPREQHPKKKKKREHKHQVTTEQPLALSFPLARRKVGAEQLPLSHRTSATSLKRSTLVPVTLTSQTSGEALKHSTVAQKYGAPPEATHPTKHPPSVMAEVSELAHYEPMGVVDHPHPGQDFDDEVPTTLSGKKDKDRSKGHTVEIKAEYFALVCAPCLEQLSDETRMRPLGTCTSKGHVIKKMIVRPEDGRFVSVRRQTLPNGQICQKTFCERYPNCNKGDMCQLAHGEEELGYWTGMYKEKKELCLDCRSQAAEHVVQQCRVNGHEATVVVYSHAQRREFVPVYWPVNASNVRWFTVKADHLRTCHDRMKCSFPHHYLEQRILNLWRQNSVATDTRPSPKWFLAELKRAATINMKMGPLPKEVLSERDGCLSEPITRANYVEKLFLLTEWEQHTHMEALEKFNGLHEFHAISSAEMEDLLHDQQRKREQKYAYYITLFMSDMRAGHLRQAASWVSLKFENGIILEGSIQRLPTQFWSKSCLAVGIDETSSKGGGSQGQDVPEFLTRVLSKRVDVTFILKHIYFTSLRKALCLIPPDVVDKLVPNIETLKIRDIIDTADDDLDYLVIDEFDLDDDYQEPACHKILESSTAAPFLITGPFGAGKTRLLATVALRILLNNPNRFILIATHHIRTADQYIQKYFAPLLEEDNFEMKQCLKVIRVVGENPFHEPKIKKYTHIVRSMDLETVGKYNLIITTFGIMLQLQRGLKKKKWPCFSHIFIDEGAQARESETLGAFSHADGHTKIVIAGDHKQVGPQTSVLGSKARDNGFTVSLVARLHKLYGQEDLQKAAKPYQAVMLTNHRSHPSILCLPNSLFYDCSLQASSKSQLHPDYRSALHFVCTSLDEFNPGCNWDKDKVYSSQVSKDVEAAGEWVERFIDDENWPKVEWGEMDLSTLCVVVPNKYVERQWRKYAHRYDRKHGFKTEDEGLRAVTCTVAYDIQGREFRAIFICTSEGVDERCATRDPVKSLCDQFVFNTVITRACSLVVAIGNPFRLMKIEEMGSHDQDVDLSAGKRKKCWQTFIFHCLQCKSLVLTEELMYVRRSFPKKACEQKNSLSNLEDIMFREARQGLKKLSQTPDDFGDSIMQAYNDCFAKKKQKLALDSSTTEGTLEWTAEKAEPQHAEHVEKEAPEGAILYRLWQNKRNLCTAVPVDPGLKKSYLTVGVHNRKCAFDGALVEIEVMNEESRHAKVVAVREQGSVQPKICVVDSFDPSVFIPVDKKSPRLVNLPHVSRTLMKSDSSGDEFSREFKKAQERKAPYVVCFDPLHLKPKQVPKISHIIPKEVAQHLLFVVCPVKWAPGKLYPLGAVVAVLPKGSSELYACQVLSIEHQVPDHGSHESPQPDQDYQLHGLNHPPEESLPAARTDAIGIVSRRGHCSLALSVDEMEDSYVVGIHVCNVAALVSTSDEFHEYSFDNWSAMYGQCQGKQVYHAALPQSGEQDLVQEMEFNCDAARRSITLKMKVSAKEHDKLVEAVASRQVLRSPECVELEVNGQGFEESTVQCGTMLHLPSLDGLLATLVRGDKQEKHEELDEAQQDKMTVLSAVADELCLDRQDHRGYPELQQTQQAFLYPEAWKLVHGLVTYASMEAADHIAAVFCSKTLLHAQHPPLEESIKGVAEVSFYSILNQFPYFCNLDLPKQHGRQHAQPIDIICTRSHYRELIRALKKVDVARVRQLLMQPHHYPQLGVLEGMIKDALLREEYVVKRISAEPKKDSTYAELLEKAGGKHHSLRAVVAPYTSPFDSIFDIYVQYMLTRAIQDQDVASTERRQEVDQGDISTPLGMSKQVDQLEVNSLHKMARLCNIAVANARSFESSMNSVDLAVSAQHSSICVEAFIKKMEDGTIQLCYPAPGLQGIVSIQTIKTKLVTKSDKASSAVYTARVTCVDGPCRIMKDLNYTSAPAAPKKDDVSLVVFCQRDGLLARHDIVPEYEAPTVVLSPASIQSAMNFLHNSSRDAAQKLVQMFKEEQQHRSEEAAQERADAYASEQSPSHDLIQGAPYFILNVPFCLEPGQVVKIWLRSDENEYVLTPKPQLVELNRDVRICLEHNSDIQSCFTQCALAESSTLQYSSRKVYFRIWEELVRAEAATNSVGGKEQYIFHDFQLEFADFRIPSDSTSSDYYCPVGDIWAKLPKEFLSNRQDIFPIEQGSFACIRFDVELNEDTEEDRALLERHKDRLYPGATDNHVRTVMHMVVDHVTKVEVKEEEVQEEEDDEVRMTLEDAVITADLKVKFKVVGHHNARVSPLMKDVLKKLKPRCEMQLFPMFLPIKKVYHTLRHLERNLAVNSIGENVILGRVDQLVGRSGLSKYSGEGSDHSKLLKLMKDPNVLYHHGEGGRTPLNEEQITALVFSLMNKFQLIQGPPGTGKSITGAHLAYAFVLLNRMKDAPEPATAEFADAATVGSVAALPHLKCVLYCGPSNVSVDVVLRHLHHLARSSTKGLRILRMYGKTIETLFYEGPYYDPDLFVKRDTYDIDKDLRQYALHERVHSREEIKKLDKKFAEMRRGDLIPTAEQRFQYREQIRQAEEDIIKKGQFDIVLCTCNETCGYRFRSNIAPVQCIIDEAGMTTEPEAIVALSQAEQAVLIGDHMQLQPVVKNRTAGNKGLRVSLFERYANLLKQEFSEGCTNFQRLLKQYRMVKSICDFPSVEFYNGKLETVCEDAGMVPDDFWLPSPDPIAFCDIVGKEEDAEKEEDMKTSKRNEKEARAVVNVVEALDVLAHSKADIAVITPYKAQKKLIEGKLKSKGMKPNWRLQTIDASQGSEADYVVLSMVRSKPLNQIKDKTAVLADRKWRMENLGMVADSHHLCVALTRARFGLVIIGNATLLSYSGTWNELVHHYRQCRYIVDKQWTDKVLERAKQATRKQPPPPPGRRERPAHSVKDESIEKVFTDVIKDHMEHVVKSLRKKPRMLKQQRKTAAAT